VLHRAEGGGRRLDRAAVTVQNSFLHSFDAPNLD
jgi:hypothetical protein